MALATNSVPGSIVLGGDLTGNANAPELRASGVVPGDYRYADITVDAKGRVIAAEDIRVEFAGDINGDINSTSLNFSGVDAGSYTYTNLSVNSKGFVTAASNGVAPTLSGDVSGDLDSTELSTTGVTPGTYTFATISVDTKGRLTSASNGTITLVGELTGSTSSNSLSATGVVAGSYDVVKFDVSSSGRLTYAADGEFAGDIIGNPSTNALKTQGIVAGSYTAPLFSVNSKGLVTSVSSGSVSFGGDISGSPSTTELVPSGVTPNTYTSATITVDAKGRITAAASNTVIPDASYTDKGYFRVSSGTGLTLSGGYMSGTPAVSSTTLGVVKSGDTSNISIVDGEMNVGANIPRLNEVNTFTRHLRESRQNTSATITPDLSTYNIFNSVAQTVNVTVNAPTNAVDYDMFTFCCEHDAEILPGSTSWTTTSLGVGFVAKRCYYLPSVPAVVVASDTRALKYSATGTSAWYSADWFPAPGTWNTCQVGNTIWAFSDSRWASTSNPSVSISSGDLTGTRYGPVAHDGNGFCSIQGNNSYVSSDGVTWTTHSLPLSGYTWTDIAGKDGVFIACAYSDGTLASSEYVLRSVDGGQTWTAIAVTRSAYSRVVANDQIFLLCGYNASGGLSYSATGSSWTTPPGVMDPKRAYGAGVVTAGGKDWIYFKVFSDLGNTFTVATTDGTDLVPLASDANNFISFCGAPSGRAVAIIDGSSSVFYSSNAYEPATSTTFNSHYKFSNSQPDLGYYRAECVYYNGSSYCTFY